jgi:hypothetical protein
VAHIREIYTTVERKGIEGLEEMESHCDMDLKRENGVEMKGCSGSNA